MNKHITKVFRKAQTKNSNAIEQDDEANMFASSSQSCNGSVFKNEPLFDEIINKVDSLLGKLNFKQEQPQQKVFKIDSKALDSAKSAYNSFYEQVAV